MSILCVFLPCRWVHVVNVDGRYLQQRIVYRNYGPGDVISREAQPLDEIVSVGIYQCTRCKTISIGSKR